MKITQLIKKLESIKEKHGNIECVTNKMVFEPHVTSYFECLANIDEFNILEDGTLLIDAK